jgi:hypothetical protein
MKRLDRLFSVVIAFYRRLFVDSCKYLEAGPEIGLVRWMRRERVWEL